MGKLWTFVAGVPRLWWGVCGAFALCTALAAWHVVSVQQAEARGRKAVMDQARVDTALVRVVDSVRVLRAARVDTVVDTVRVRVERVREVRVPDSVLVMFPVVDTLRVVSTELASAVDSLVTAIDAERAAATMAQRVHEAAAVSARVQVVALRDTVTTLQKRPRWRTVAGMIGVGVAGGFLWGKQ